MGELPQFHLGPRADPMSSPLDPNSGSASDWRTDSYSYAYPYPSSSTHSLPRTLFRLPRSDIARVMQATVYSLPLAHSTPPGSPSWPDDSKRPRLMSSPSAASGAVYHGKMSRKHPDYSSLLDGWAEADCPDRPSVSWLVLPFVVTFAHVLWSPYTKVEETPALHAVHDMLSYGISPSALQKYDHINYPGAVPRSMTPSLILAFTTYPLSVLGWTIGLIQTQADIQTLVRLVLATFFSVSFAHLTSSVHKTFSPLAAKMFVLVSMTQFHIPYYAGRTLPNFLALPLILLTFSKVLRSSLTPQGVAEQKIRCPLAMLTLTATVVRLELAPLAVAVASGMVFQRRLSLRSAVEAGAAGGVVGLLLTTVVDSYFYSPLRSTFCMTWWPELSAFCFNILQGRSADWGVMPVYYYLFALLKMGMAAVPLALFGLTVPVEANAREERRLSLLLGGACVVFVAALSCIGHKEWRFVVYVVPVLNILAAQGAATAWTDAARVWRYILRFGIISGLVAQLLLSLCGAYISALNYPGGQVAPLLQALAAGTPRQKVWLPAAALHSGTTLFTLPEMAPAYLSEGEKEGHLEVVHPESAHERCSRPFGHSPAELWAEGFGMVVTDDWETFEQWVGDEGQWKVFGEVNGLSSVSLDKETWGPRVDVERVLAVMGRVEYPPCDQ